MTSIVISNSVTSIHTRTFSGCTKITDITIPDNVTSIEPFVFSGCSSLTNIKLPNGISSIEWGMFNDCTSLQEVEIPETVSSIKEEAFLNCSKLSCIKIPKNVKQIGYNAFKDCVSLERIEVAAENPVYDNRNGCNAIIETAYDELILIGSKESAIPSGVTRIDTDAFLNCKELTKIYIPKEVTSISGGAFVGCDKLTSIEVASQNVVYDSRKKCNAIIETATSELVSGCQSTVIPKGVTTIGYSAFSDCKNIKNINIPDSVTTIKSSAFRNCENLTNVNIPDSVTTLGGSVFAYCTNLKTIRFSKNITEIPYGAFEGCSRLKKIDIPENVTSIGDCAFSGCAALEEVNLSEKISSIGKEAFSYCKKIRSITIPDSVITIEEHAFEECSGLKSIHFSSNITSIGEWSFWGCENLTDVMLPESLESVGEGAFFNTKLKKIIIPKGVKDIGQVAFGYKDNGEVNKVEKYVIYGTKGSAAETYAKENGFTFKTIAGKTKLTSKNTKVKLSKTAFNFDGKAQKPTVKVFDTKGRTLKKSYYTVTYSNIVKVGKATATITFKGKYSGTIKKTFTIKPAKTTITGTSRKSDSVTLTWKKQKKEASGYQIQYATDRKFTKNAKTVVSKGTKKSSKKISGLSKKTTYYFRIRTYKSVNGKKYYSGWSKVETVKTK